VAERDPRFERENGASELQIKMEMDRRVTAYFAKKHGTPWRWCATCYAWSAAHEHRAVSNG
jgi:hypothetical protein